MTVLEGREEAAEIVIIGAAADVVADGFVREIGQERGLDFLGLAEDRNLHAIGELEAADRVDDPEIKVAGGHALVLGRREFAIHGGELFLDGGGLAEFFARVGDLVGGFAGLAALLGDVVLERADEQEPDQRHAHAGQDGDEDDVLFFFRGEGVHVSAPFREGSIRG